MRTFETSLDKYWLKTFSNADYFEALKFSFKYDTAVSVYKYAHGGVIDSREIADYQSWNIVVKRLLSLVPLADRNRIEVRVFNYKDIGNGDGLSGGRTSGFVFSIDRKLIGWTTWMNWMS